MNNQYKNLYREVILFSFLTLFVLLKITEINVFLRILEILIISLLIVLVSILFYSLLKFFQSEKEQKL